jgi:imidazoleglycerol-phosphate dehydratase/histidinol-phosphatase
MKRKIAFLDRDGTLIVEPPVTFQVDTLDQIYFLPGTISALKQLTEAGFTLVFVTNQDALGTPANPRENYELINQKIFDVFASEGIHFWRIFECPHIPEENCTCRKPKVGILGDDFNWDEIDKKQSFMVGDRQSDIDFATNIGVSGYLLAPAKLKDGVVEQSTEGMTWAQIIDAVINKPRVAAVDRKTKETEIEINLNLDGSGKYHISTGLNFFDHMLEQLAKHGNFDLNLNCTGDLEIDEHHTIEDTALALGDAFKQAIGDKRGITRYAFERVLPMDEARAEVALDFSGRPHLEYDITFTREYVGDFPTEMLEHFFRSFCERAGLNLHLTVTGKNTHHMVEVAFKSFARCLRDSVMREGNALPSTKGVL